MPRRSTVYNDDELDPKAAIWILQIVRTEGNRGGSRLIDHYGLPVILAVGYRVRSARMGHPGSAACFPAVPGAGMDGNDRLGADGVTKATSPSWVPAQYVRGSFFG